MIDNDPDLLKSRIYRQFKSAAEYNTPWLNPQTEDIIPQANEEFLLDAWTPIYIQLDQPFKKSLKNSLFLLLIFSVYAILAYFILDGGQKPADNAIQALFFPLMPYAIVCYRDIGTFLKSFAGSIFIFLITVGLLDARIITVNGVVFFRWIIPILKVFALTNLYPPVLETLSIYEIVVSMAILIAVLYVFEFIILIITGFVSKGDPLELKLSRENIYIRGKTKSSIFRVLYMGLWIILNPLNVKQYLDIMDRIRYNKISQKLGKRYDFGKIPPSALYKIEKKKERRTAMFILGITIYAIGLIVLPGAMLSSDPSPIIFLGFFAMIIGLFPTKKFRISFYFDRAKIEGSWILSHDKSILRLKHVPAEIAQHFTPFKH